MARFSFVLCALLAWTLLTHEAVAQSQPEPCNPDDTQIRPEFERRPNSPEDAAICFVAENLLHRLEGNRQQRVRTAARVTWWFLQEGIPALYERQGFENVHQFNNCSPGEQKIMDPLQPCDCPDPTSRCPAWQVGLAGVQVPDVNLAEIDERLASLFGPQATRSDVLEQSANLWNGTTRPTISEILDKQNMRLTKSWLLRHPLIGFTFELRAVNKCIRDFPDGSFEVKSKAEIKEENPNAFSCAGRGDPDSTQQLWAPNAEVSEEVIRQLERFYSQFQRETGVPISAALALDSSGSMIWNDPDDLRKQGARVFVDAAKSHDQVSIIDFDSNAAALAPRQPVGGAANRRRLKERIDLIDSSGGTSLSSALEKAFLELGRTVAIDDPRRRAAVLMTDGRGPLSDFLVDAFSAQGWPIYTVGLGDGVDNALLSDIAKRTNGDYFQLTGAQQLERVYFEISSQLAGGEVIEELQALIRLHEVVRRLVTIPEGITELRVLTDWPGSNFETVLINPRGRRITPTAAGADVRHEKGLSHSFYSISDPTAGTWEVVLRGLEVPTGGESVTVTISGIRPAGNSKPMADAGDPQTIECTSPSGATVELDGSGSTDPDGDELTFDWEVDGTNTVGPMPTVELPFGSHLVHLEVSDGRGGVDSDVVEVVVRDSNPPTIHALNITPDMIWPPNHRMVDVSVAPEVSDTCDPMPVCALVEIGNDQDTINGTAKNDPDSRIVSALRAEVRAERNGAAGDRRYRLSVSCRDESQNRDDGYGHVLVPHDQGKRGLRR